MIHSEWRAQETDHKFLRLALPPDAYFTAIDHGNLRQGRSRHSGMIAGKRRKDRGVKAGIPDWLIVWRGITLWIERKVDAHLSEAQKQTAAALRGNGHHWFLARSLEEVETACREAGIPLSATADTLTTRETRPRTKANGGRKAEPRFVAGKRMVARAAKAGVLI